MKIIVCPPNEQRYCKEITTFKQLQDTVGGYVQVTQIANEPTLVLAVNEDGQQLNLEPNREFPLTHDPADIPEGAIVLGEQLPYILGTVVIMPADWHDQLD